MRGPGPAAALKDQSTGAAASARAVAGSPAATIAATISSTRRAWRLLAEAGIDPVRLSVVEQDAHRPPVARRAGRLPVVDPLLTGGIPPIAGATGSAESRRSGSCTAGRTLLRWRQPLRRCRRRDDRAVRLLQLELRGHRAARLELAALQADLVRRVVDRLQETVKSVDDSERIRESGRVAGEVDSVSGVCVRSHAVGEPARELPAARRGQA